MFRRSPVRIPTAQDRTLGGPVNFILESALSGGVDHGAVVPYRPFAASMATGFPLPVGTLTTTSVSAKRAKASTLPASGTKGCSGETRGPDEPLVGETGLHGGRAPSALVRALGGGGVTGRMWDVAGLGFGPAQPVRESFVLR